MSKIEYEIILYVADQERSKSFYSEILQKEPSLDVPGMTEFILGDNFKLGIMPESGIKKILRDKTPDPETGNGIPRCELYISGDSQQLYSKAIKAGAREISEIQIRNWGDMVGYVMDFDGHIVAFAEKTR